MFVNFESATVDPLQVLPPVAAGKAQIPILGTRGKRLHFSADAARKLLETSAIRRNRHYNLCLPWDRRCLRTHIGSSPAITEKIDDVRNQDPEMDEEKLSKIAIRVALFVPEPLKSSLFFSLFLRIEVP
jgi:hypothetical protein